MRVRVLHRNMSLHVFNDDNGVVDHQASGQGNAKERKRIDGEAEQLDKCKGADERDRDGDRRNDGGTPIEQEQENDRDDDDNGLAQRDHDFLNGVVHGRGGIEGDLIFEPRRETSLQLFQSGLGARIHIERVGVGELLHADAMRRVAVVLQH